jgi:cytochrome c5
MKVSARSTLAALVLVLSGHCAAADGRKVYESTCIACHATGVGGAPKLGDKAAWAPRLAVGRDGLVKSVVSGKGAMPPRAGNPKLADADIRAAVDHMLASVK